MKRKQRNLEEDQQNGRIRFRVIYFLLIGWWLGMMLAMMIVPLFFAGGRRLIKKAFGVRYLGFENNSYAGLKGKRRKGMSLLRRRRQFTAEQKRERHASQGGRCAICGYKVSLEDSEADHIVPWSKWGPTTSANCQILCRPCNRRKSDKVKLGIPGILRRLW